MQIAGSDEKPTYSNIARPNYRTRVMLLPALLAGGGRVWRCSQLVVARALHCSCDVCCLWCLGYVHDTKKKLKKIKMISAMIEVAPSSPKSGVVTCLLYYQISTLLGIIFRGANDTPHAHAQQHSRKKRCGGDRRRTAAPDRATSKSSTPRTRDTRAVWAAGACGARRGCNVVCVLCMLSACIDLWFYGVCFGRKTLQ